jgi:hypothetical protein
VAPREDGDHPARDPTVHVFDEHDPGDGGREDTLQGQQQAHFRR